MKKLPFKRTPMSLALTGLLVAGFAQADSPNSWGPWGGGGHGGGGPFGHDGNGGHGGDYDDNFLVNNQRNFENQFGGDGPTSLADMAFLQAGNFFGFYNGISDSGSHNIFMQVFFGEGVWNGFFNGGGFVLFDEGGPPVGDLSFSAFGEVDGNTFSSTGLEGCECEGSVNGQFFGSNAASARGGFNVVGEGELSANDTFNIPQTSLEGPGGLRGVD